MRSHDTLRARSRAPRASRAPQAIAALAAITVSAAIAGCQQQVQVAAPPTFNRPAAIELVCFHDGAPVALEECRPSDDGMFGAGDRLVALVPQQTRGEVGAVDLSADPPRVIDSDRRVPGFTFVETGEVPTAIAVSRTSPSCAWVANRGSRDVWAIETVRFIDESMGTGAVPAQLELRDALGVASGRPHAMVLDESGATPALYVTLPEDGALARIEVSMGAGGCSFGAATLIPVPADPADVPAPPPPPTSFPIDPTLAPLETQDAATLAVCNASTRAIALAEVPEHVELAPVGPADLDPPFPLEMVLERDERTIYVGDAARPVIHRFDLAAGSFATPLRPDGPVRDLAITPPVPDSLAPGAPTRRYLYAIDDRDGTVMVLDLSTGYVLPVAPVSTGRPLRIPLRTQARAIEVIDTGDGGDCGADPLPTSLVLRGVFVSVALADGTVQFVDVYDRDAVCRSGASCADLFSGVEQLSFVRRHRPRIGSRIVEPIGLLDPPTATLVGASLRYADDGTVPDETSVPVFQALAGCPEGLGQLFPSEGELRICGQVDPWNALNEAFQLTWQGALPSTGTPAGRLEDAGAQVILETRLPLCERGVLGPQGAAGLPSDAPEAGYPGDLVALTGPLPDPLPEGVDETTCMLLAGTVDAAAPQPMLIPIAAAVATDPALGVASEVEIVLDRDAIVVNRDLVASGEGTRPLTVADVLACYGQQLLTFDVRARDAYTVLGSNSGFLHRTTVDASGNCVVDTTQPASRVGRARLDRLYESGRLALQLSYPTPPAVIPDTTIAFRVTDAPGPARVDLGVSSGGGRTLTLPGELLWSDLTDRLYALDEVRRGLVIIDVAPLAIRRSID